VTPDDEVGRRADSDESTAAISGLPAGAFGPILVLLLVLASDFWVFEDAKARRERGTPVVFTGFVNLETPGDWFVGCLLVWIVFFPLYIMRRG
jgi:hypothetical protein